MRKNASKNIDTGNGTSTQAHMSASTGAGTPTQAPKCMNTQTQMHTPASGNPPAQAHIPTPARDREVVVHEIAPVFDKRSRVLLLGSMPSPKSREVGFFYGNPQNRFWRVLAALFDEPIAQSIDEKRDMLLRHRIALWDVLASCSITGASDASIRDAQPNDLRPLLDATDIRAVFATGTQAAKLYRRLCEPTLGVPCTALPSTSPANAQMSLDALVNAYRVLLPYLEE